MLERLQPRAFFPKSGHLRTSAVATVARADALRTPTQLSDGEAVELLVEKAGYRAARQQHIAGAIANVRIARAE